MKAAGGEAGTHGVQKRGRRNFWGVGVLESEALYVFLGGGFGSTLRQD